MKNFRQFYGEQNIDLSPAKEGTNVTVIFGENGRGKTGIYRALMFCLYGERKLAQDGEDGKKEISLVNKIALSEAQEKNQEAEAFVKVDFEHSQEKYSIKRSLLGMICDGEEIEQLGSVCLTVTQSDGNAMNYTRNDEINLKVNAILDKRVREYFLFDGEKIERLTRTTRNQKKEVEIGIKNLLNIDELFVAGKGVGLCLRNMEKRLEKESTGEYKKLLFELTSKEEKQEGLKVLLEESIKEIAHAEEEEKDYTNKLSQFKGIEQFLKRRKELDGSKVKICTDRDELLKEMTIVNDSIGLILMETDMREVEAQLGEMVDNDAIPSLIRERMIKNILESNICICDRKIEKGCPEYEAILKWKNKVLDQQVEDGLLDTHRRIGITNEFIKAQIERVEQSLQSYSSKSQEIDMIESELKAISEEIGGGRAQNQEIVDEDLSKFERSRNLVIQRIGKLELKCEQIEAELKVIKDEVKVLVSKKEELALRQGKADLLARRAKLVREVKDALENIYEAFTEEIKVKIGTKASEIFKNLIDEQGKQTFREIVVSDDYSLQLNDFRGKPFLANISAGQRQIMSISFITALAQIAGNKNTLELPLFMDTPFGRLSGEHRDKLIENLPELTMQWVLLATDTEFTEKEAKTLKETKKWSRVYNLNGTEPFKTIVEAVKISEFNFKK